MRNRLLSSAAAVFAVIVMTASVPVFAGEVELFQDVETGQVFTKPGKNRILLGGEETEAVKAAMPALYQDPETGAVFARPAEGRIPMASSARETSGQAVDEDAIAEKAARKVEEKMASKSPVDIPSWVKKIKLHGDLRLRYDIQDTEGKVANHRGRYRTRIFLEAPVNDWFKTYFMLASGGSDPKSANQTFGPSFEAPDLRLRHAYAEFTPFDWLMVRGGQMENILWRPSDAVWDKDIKPTGAGVSLVYKNESFVEPFMNNAFYVIQQSSSSSQDPYMYVLQPGVGMKLSDRVGLKLAVSYYGFESLEGAVLSHRAGSNSLVQVGVDDDGNPIRGLRFDYDGVVASGELGIRKPLPFVEQLKLFGEYAYNFDPDVLNDGYIVGLKFGDKKIKEFGDWELAYSWRRMGRDAVLDILPDSDAFSGKTNITGHEVIAKFGLAKHVEFGLDYYNLKDITTDIDEHRFQMDFIFAFGK